MSLRIGRVVGVHPEDNSVDLVMNDGTRLAGVQIMSGTATGNTGTHDLPTMDRPEGADKWDVSKATERDMIAVVASVGTQALVLGFLFPQVSQMLFKDQNRRVMRHASDVYSTIDGSGNFEMAWPNGTYVRVGSTPDHEDLSGQDVDGRWALTKNTGAQTYVRLGLAGGKAVFTIDPSGNITLAHDGNLAITSGGTLELTSAGNMTLTAPRIDLNP